MWSEDEIITYLKENLKPKRFEHSIGVRDTAIKLAEVYGENVEKARLAGLVHDCAKNMTDKQMLDVCLKIAYNIDEVSKEMPSILHGMVGAYVAEKVMGIEDDEVLNAVTYHTTGKKDMTLLEKIIYIADYIEPSRDFKGVEILRELAYNKGIDDALMWSFDNTIKYVIDRKQLLHNKTIEARNYILYNK